LDARIQEETERTIKLQIDMNEDVHKALFELQAALDEIDNWAKLLEDAGKGATEAKEGALEAIDAAKNTILKAQETLEKFTRIIQELRERYLEDMDECIKLYKELINKINALVAYLDSFDFSTRFDRVDDKLNQILAELDEIDRQFNKQLTRIHQIIEKNTAEIVVQLAKNQSELIMKIDKLEKNVTRRLTAIIILIIVFATAGALYFILF